MHRLAEWVMGVAAAFGGPGLFLLAFLDSSFLSFPEVVDLLIMGLVIRHKDRLLYYALLPTLGSIAGSYILYALARKGGQSFVRRRFHERHVDRALALFQKYGLLAVAVPAIMPPPMPFKAFVLAAGVAGVRRVDFIVALALGRGVRYFGEAFLALWYGERAVTYVSEHAGAVGLVVAVLVIGLASAWMIVRSRRAQTP